MIKYQKEWDLLEMYYFQGGYTECYSYYLYLINEYQSFYPQAFEELKEKTPQYYKYIKLICNRLRLVRASCAVYNALEQFMSKPQAIDLEMLVPGIYERIKSFDDIDGALDQVLTPNTNLKQVMSGHAADDESMVFRVVENSYISDILAEFACNRYIQGATNVFATYGINLVEINEYGRIFMETLTVIIQDFKDDVKYWPRWLIDTGSDETPMKL